MNPVNKILILFGCLIVGSLGGASGMLTGAAPCCSRLSSPRIDEVLFLVCCKIFPGAKVVSTRSLPIASSNIIVEMLSAFRIDISRKAPRTSTFWAGVTRARSTIFFQRISPHVSFMYSSVHGVHYVRGVNTVNTVNK